MSLSRPVRFPLLKLPYLSIDAVVKSWDVFDIIFFALTSKKTRRIVKSLTIPLNGIHISLLTNTCIWLCGRVSKNWYLQRTSFESLLGQNARKTSFTLRDDPKPLYISVFFTLVSQKTRRIVKHLKIPLTGIKIFVREGKRIELERRRWEITKTICDSFFEKYANSRKDILVHRNNGISLYTKKTNDALMSYTYGNEVTALKLAMEFLNEVFKCSVETVHINGDNFPESRDIGVRSTVNLYINGNSSQPFGYAQSQQLSSLLENLKVTGTCTLWMSNTENGVYVDPKLYKCKALVFNSGSAAWVTRETFLQFEVPRLTFLRCPFSVEDILSFVINWFHSDDNKLEYFDILYQDGRISLENFQTKELNPVPISERNRAPSTDAFSWKLFVKTA